MRVGGLFVDVKTRHADCTCLAGDAMIREIDVSRMTMRIRRKADKSHDEDNEDSIHAKLTGNTLELLKKHLVWFSSSSSAVTGR